MKRLIFTLFSIVILSSCGKKQEREITPYHPPIVSADGTTVEFTENESLAFFRTEKLGAGALEGTLTAPGQVAATVLSSGGSPIILFNNSDLAGSYSQLRQHQTNISQIENVAIKQKQLELERTKDLLKHGAVTGQDVINLETELAIEQSNLINERTALTEQEGQIKLGGFDPKTLQNLKANTAYVICDLPENQIGNIETGATCEVRFSAFPEEVFNGKVDGIASVVDQQNRMMKVRIVLNNENNRIKSGMYAQVSFEVKGGTDVIMLNKAALVTVQGKHYVFVKTGPMTFERKPVQIGQQIEDRVLILSGLESGDEVATEGVMQLKGLSFGY